MKFKKLLALGAAFAMSITACALAACGGEGEEEQNPPPGPSVPDKVTYGLPVAERGRYIKDSDLIQDGASTRYLLYTTNETSGEEDNAIAVRKAVYEEGEDKGWGYHSEKIAVRGEEGEWDEYIGSGSLVKGSFALNGKDYGWMIAYCATAQNNDTQYQIGLAVAETPDGTWTKVSENPVIEFDAAVYGESMVGCYAPSLVNLDRQSKIRLFYTYADVYGHFAKFVDFDASDLGAIELSGEVQCPNGGEIEGGDSVAMFPNADFAYDADSELFYAVKDYSPSASLAPAYAERIQLLYIDENELYTAEDGLGWTDIYMWDNTDTPDAAFERLYGACIVSDAYGHIDGAVNAEIIYNVCELAAENGDWMFTQNVLSFDIGLE